MNKISETWSIYIYNYYFIFQNHLNTTIDLDDNELCYVKTFFENPDKIICMTDIKACFLVNLKLKMNGFDQLRNLEEQGDNHWAQRSVLDR